MHSTFRELNVRGMFVAELGTAKVYRKLDDTTAVRIRCVSIGGDPNYLRFMPDERGPIAFEPDSPVQRLDMS